MSIEGSVPILACFLFKVILFFLILTIIVNVGILPSTAQWRKLNDFGKPIFSIYFKSFTNTPTLGFVGAGLVDADQNKLWKTVDGGISWQPISYSPDNTGIYSFPSSFTFKNTQEGWFSDFGHQGNLLYWTLDGGNTWTSLPSGDMNSVYFVQSNGLIIGSCNNGSYVYSSDNITFKTIHIPQVDYTLNICFSDALHGILSPVNGINKLLFTSDAGITWAPVDFEGDFFQPVGLSGTTTFYALREAGLNNNSGTLFRSNDGGISWQMLYQYRDNSFLSTTGTVQYGVNQTLFFQTTKNNSEGIMMSSDSGKSFNSICGPTNDIDTRFYVRDSFIYAGDKQGGLWLNTTGIGSNSTPQLSLQKLNFLTPGCKQFDTAMIFTFFDSCNGIQAKLVSASIQGSNSFSFSSPSAIPRTIHPNDSLVISYKPQSPQADTAQLHLKFHLGWKDLDTTIQLFGSGRFAKESIRLVPSTNIYSTRAGSSVDISYLSDKNISGRNLDSISFDLLYNTDLLDYRSISTSIPGAALTLTPSPSGRGSGVRVTIRGSNMTLDSLKPVVTLHFMPMVTKSLQTPIVMSNLQLNGGDPNYANCILSADTSNAAFTLITECGDLTVMKYMNGIFPLQITSIRPNPAQDEIELNIKSQIKEEATIEIFDALGVKVYWDARSLLLGANTLYLDMRSLSSGVYLLRIGNTSQSFVKVK